MYCMHCGSKTAENSLYCVVCGKRLAQSLSQPEGTAFAGQPMASSQIRQTSPTQATVSMTSLQVKSPGAWMIIGTGVLCLLAFFCMPYVTIPILGAASGGQLAGFQPDGSVTWIQALWLQPLLALVMIGLAIPTLIKNYAESEGPLGAFVLMLAIGMFIVEIAATIYLNSQMSNSYSSISITSFYSTGFWVYNLGLVLAVIGSLIHLHNNPVDRIDQSL